MHYIWVYVINNIYIDRYTITTYQFSDNFHKEFVESILIAHD